MAEVVVTFPPPNLVSYTYNVQCTCTCIHNGGTCNYSSPPHTRTVEVKKASVSIHPFLIWFTHVHMLRHVHGRSDASAKAWP